MESNEAPNTGQKTPAGSVVVAVVLGWQAVFSGGWAWVRILPSGERKPEKRLIHLDPVPLRPLASAAVET